MPPATWKGLRASTCASSPRGIVHAAAAPMALVDDAGRWAIEPGAFGVYVGGGQPVERTGGAGVAGQFHIVGETTPISNTYGV